MAPWMMVESEKASAMATKQRDRYRASAGWWMRRRLCMEGITPMWGKASQREPVTGAKASGGGLCVIVTDHRLVEEGQAS
jgi:hypothetical protein